MTVASSLLHPLSCLRFLIVEKGCSVGKMFKDLNIVYEEYEEIPMGISSFSSFSSAVKEI